MFHVKHQGAQAKKKSFAKAGGTPRMPPAAPPPQPLPHAVSPTAQAAPLPQPPTPSLSCLDNARAPRYRTGDISPAAAQHLAAAPASRRLVPADARHLAGDAPAARNTSPAAPPQRAAPRQQQPRGLAVPRRHPRPRSASPGHPRPHGASPPRTRGISSAAPPPHGRTTLRQRRPAAPSASRHLASNGPVVARIGRRADARPRGVRLARAGPSRT